MKTAIYTDGFSTYCGTLQEATREWLRLTYEQTSDVEEMGNLVRESAGLQLVNNRRVYCKSVLSRGPWEYVGWLYDLPNWVWDIFRGGDLHAELINNLRPEFGNYFFDVR